MICVPTKNLLPTTKPDLSIIIPSYNARDTIVECLQALSQQDTAHSFEIIIVDSSDDGTADLVARLFPEVQLYRFLSRKYPGDGRNYGIHQSRADLLAFVDADCTAHTDWVERIIVAHQTAGPIIGGAVDNGSRDSYIGWAYFLSEFNEWMPEDRAYPKQLLPTCCYSMKRHVFDECGPFLEGVYCSDTAFDWRVAEAGYPLLFLPDIVVSHIYGGSLSRFLQHEFEQAYSFARIRITERTPSAIRKLYYVLRSPILPALMFYRAGKHVFQKNLYHSHFLLTAPLIFLSEIAWALGELVGYLTQIWSDLRASPSGRSSTIQRPD